MALSAAAITISIFVFWENRRRNVVERTFDFLNEWREPSFFEMAAQLQDKSFYEGVTQLELEKGISCLGQDREKKFRTVSHFMDYLGAAAQNGILDETLLFSAISGSIENLWKMMGPIIEAERKKRASDPKNKDRSWRYQIGFEHLAEKSRRFRQDGRYLEMWKYRGQLDDIFSGAAGDIQEVRTV